MQQSCGLGRGAGVAVHPDLHYETQQGEPGELFSGQGALWRVVVVCLLAGRMEMAREEEVGLVCGPGCCRFLMRSFCAGSYASGAAVGPHHHGRVHWMSPQRGACKVAAEEPRSLQSAVWWKRGLVSKN